jgi:hypothetical protein
MAQSLRARLGPLVSRVHSTVGPAYSATEKVVVEQYDKILKGGEQYVVKDPAEADKLLKKWFYTKLSRLAAPPRSPHTHVDASSLAGQTRMN